MSLDEPALNEIITSEFNVYGSASAVAINALDQCDPDNMSEQKVENVSRLTSKNVYGMVLKQYYSQNRLFDSVEFSSVTRDALCYIINGKRVSTNIKPEETSEGEQKTYVTDIFFPFFIAQLKSIDPTLSYDLCYRIFSRVLCLCNPVALGIVKQVLGCYNIHLRNAVIPPQDEPIPNEYIISKSKNFLGKTKINLKCVLYFQYLLDERANTYGTTFKMIIDYGNLLTLDGKPLEFLPKLLRTFFRQITPEASGQFGYAQFSALGLGGGSVRKKKKNSKLKHRTNKYHTRRRKSKNKSRRKNKSHRKNKSRRKNKY